MTTIWITQAPLKCTQLAFMLSWTSWSCFVSNVSGSTLEINDDDLLRLWPLSWAWEVVGERANFSGLEGGAGNGSAFSFGDDDGIVINVGVR